MVCVWWCGVGVHGLCVFVYLNICGSMNVSIYMCMKMYVYVSMYGVSVVHGRS